MPPLLDAIVAVLRRGERFLVIQRGPAGGYAGHWAPLSGRLEPGETQAQALVREVREEVGLDVTPGAKVWESRTANGLYKLHWWTADSRPDQVLTPAPDEVSAARWVTVAEFLALTPTFAEDRVFVTRVLPAL